MIWIYIRTVECTRDVCEKWDPDPNIIRFVKCYKVNAKIQNNKLIHTDMSRGFAIQCWWQSTTIKSLPHLQLINSPGIWCAFRLHTKFTLLFPSTIFWVKFISDQIFLFNILQYSYGVYVCVCVSVSLLSYGDGFDWNNYFR